MKTGQDNNGQSTVNLSEPASIRARIAEIRRVPTYEAIVRAGGESAYRAQAARNGRGSVEGDVESFRELNKELSALYEKLGG